MLFCKLLAGIFLVGGVVQASYCFDIQRLIINNTKETKDVEEQIPLLSNHTTGQQTKTITEFIAQNVKKITASEAEITTQSTKADTTWATLKAKLNLTDDDKKGIEGITEIVAETQAEIKETATQIKKSEIAIKKQGKELKKAEAQAKDPNAWFFQKLIHQANAKLIKGKMGLDKAYSTSKTAKNTKLTNQLTVTQAALKDQLALKEKQDAKNALIAEIQLREELDE